MSTTPAPPRGYDPQCEQFGEFLAGAVGPDAFRDHAASCPACRAALQGHMWMEVVGEQVALRTAEMEPVVEARVAAAVAPLHAELAGLRARMAETENTMAEFVSAISMMCRQAAGRNQEERAVAVDAPAVEPQAGTWRIPVAS